MIDYNVALENLTDGIQVGNGARPDQLDPTRSGNMRFDETASTRTATRTSGGATYS